MPGTVILSHGFESGPEAIKTSAMARAAETLGWRTLRPDYREHDALGMEAAAEPRCRQLRELAQGVDGPLILAGSSMGAYVSGWVSREVDCAGLFLLAVPALVEHDYPFDCRTGIPTTLVHGYDDELCPVDEVIALARRRGAELMLVPDGHRLAGHVPWIAGQFVVFLRQFGPQT